MKPLTPRNLWNHETTDTTKPWNPWHHETYETMKQLTPQNLWNHETIDTTKPMKPWNLWNYGTIDTTKPMKPETIDSTYNPWPRDTFIIWHRHWHILISINSCTVTPSNNRSVWKGAGSNFPTSYFHFSNPFCFHIQLIQAKAVLLSIDYSST